MIDQNEIWEALESSVASRKEYKANATRVDTLNHRDMLMRFLEELDGELSVAEVRDALGEYK